MSLNESDYKALNNAMSAFELALDKKLKERWSQVKKSDNSKLLEGITLEELRNRLFKVINDHIDQLNVNVHNLTPDQLDTFAKDTLEGLLDGYMDLDSGMPLSFYGDRTYLPAPVDGSFESTSVYSPTNSIPCFVEDDGTYVAIRNGTDGSTFGPYYSHCRDIANPNISPNVINTNKKYRPAFLPKNHESYLILSGNDHVIVGVSKNTTTGGLFIFLALTNGTFDSDYHEGVLFPIESLPTGTGAMNRATQPNAIMVGGKIYLLIPRGALSFEIWSMNVSDVRDGKFIRTVRKPKINWTGSYQERDLFTLSPIDNYLGGFFTSAGKPTIYGIANWGGFRVHPVYDGDKCKIVINQHYQVGPVDNIAGWVDTAIYVEFELNDRLEFDIRPYYNDKIQITYNDNLIVLSGATTTGLLKYRYSTDRPFGTYAGGHDMVTWSLRENVSVMTIHKTVEGGMQVGRLIHDSNKTLTDVYNNNTMGNKYKFYNVVPNRPNDLFLSMLSHTWLSPTTMYFINNLNGDSKFVPTFARIPNANISTNYESILSTKRLGFPETNEKVSLYKLNPNFMDESTSLILLTEVEGDSVLVHGDSYAFNSRNDANLIHVQSLNSDGKISTVMPKKVSPKQLESLKLDLENFFKGRNGLINESDANMSFEVHIPRRGMVPFITGCYISGIGDLNKDYCFVLNCNVNNGNVVPDFTSFMEFRPNDTLVKSIFLHKHRGDVQIRRLSGKNEYIITCTTSAYLDVPGNYNCRSFAMHYNPTSRRYTPVVLPYGSDISNGPGGLSIHPTHGVMSIISSTVDANMYTDGGTKTLFLNLFNDSTFSLGTTYDPYANIYANGRVLLSQKSPARWMIYFSEDIPVMLSGKYGVIEASSYSLNPSTDKNSNFYIWFVEENGKFKHVVVKNDSKEPKVGAFFVGHVKTDETGISLIDVDKNIAIDGYYLSDEPMGNAIPLSTGPAVNEKELEWAD